MAIDQIKSEAAAAITVDLESSRTGLDEKLLDELTSEPRVDLTLSQKHAHNMEGL